jgi:hypothetical protein
MSVRKPTWKYSPAMKKAQLETFIKQHGIPAPDHPKRPELMLLVSDYVTHLIMDDMRRHDKGEPLQHTNIEAMKKMKEQLSNLNIPKVAEIPSQKMEEVIKKAKTSKSILKSEPIGDKTKYTSKDFLQDEINDIEKEINKLEEKSNNTSNEMQLRLIDKKIDKLQKELNQKYDEFKALGKGGRRRMRGGNFGDDLLGVMDKIGKIGQNIPLIGPAFIPMSHSSDIGKFVKNL